MRLSSSIKGTVIGKMMEPVLPFDLLPEGANEGGLTKTLHRQLRTAILEGRLPPGYALPSTRQLATQLKVGRNTVIAAYDRLVAAGFAQARPRARLVVSALGADAGPPARTPAAVVRASDARIAAVWRQPAHRLMYDTPLPACSFRTGVPEHRHFDHDIWRRLTSRALRATSPTAFKYGLAQGLPALREAIAGHVAYVRAVVCQPDDLIITSGAQEGFDLLARLLVNAGATKVAVEDPGYPPLRAAFIAAGATLVPIAVDDEGLQVDSLPDGVKVICVTPSHQSPTGAVMSPARRAALLARARALDAVVIEDDYDGEYLYDAHPPDALQTLDREGRVFYVGTFSKSLFPTLRKGFIVAPAWAREALVDIKRTAGTGADLTPQATLAAFIAEGHLARHIRRMRPLYAQRRRAFEQGALAHWAGWMRIGPGNAGLHLSTRIDDPAMAKVIMEAARLHLPGALPLSAYSIGDQQQQGLCIGYGGVDVDQIASAVRALGAALRAAGV
jgi:GntR family transcriptional regulator/MocR family aminotransferase